MNFDRKMLMQEKYKPSNRYNIRSILPFMLVLYFILCFMVCNFAIGQPPKDLSEAVNAIETQRLKAEQWASILKRDEKTITPTAYMRAVSLYIEASAAFNGLIEEMKTDLIAGLGSEKDPKYKNLIESVSLRSAQFTEYVEGLYVPERERTSLPIIAGSIQIAIDVTKFVIEIGQRSKDRKEKHRNEIIKKLNSLKWKPFDEIPVYKGQ
jgi:hypothetical protein